VLPQRPAAIGASLGRAVAAEVGAVDRGSRSCRSAPASRGRAARTDRPADLGGARADEGGRRLRQASAVVSRRLDEGKLDAKSRHGVPQVRCRRSCRGACGRGSRPPTRTRSCSRRLMVWRAGRDRLAGRAAHVPALVRVDHVPARRAEGGDPAAATGRGGTKRSAVASVARSASARTVDRTTETTPRRPRRAAAGWRLARAVGAAATSTSGARPLRRDELAPSRAAVSGAHASDASLSRGQSRSTSRWNGSRSRVSS
jgi:hypothetical protein